MTAKQLSEQDITILKAARDATEGTVKRNRLLKIFKRAGAEIEIRDRELWVVVVPDGVTGAKTKRASCPIGNGSIDFATEHAHWRSRLTEVADTLLRANNIA